jgi:mono/diheme cytochrome c family protein
MPAYRSAMTDQQIADVLTFTRQSWSNNRGPVNTSDVKKMRNEGK